jgi:hypothetical protein
VARHRFLSLAAPYVNEKKESGVEPPHSKFGSHAPFMPARSNVAICHVRGVSHLLTFNVGHFNRFASFGPGLAIVDPATV